MKIPFILLLSLFIHATASFSQCESLTIENISNYTPLTFGSLKESDGLRNGPDYAGATLYFPLNANSLFKSIVLVPGYRATQTSIEGWAKYLASRGFLCMTIGTNSIYDLPKVRANALIDAMVTLRQENQRIASPLYQKIDTNSIAVGGWSMGGGGAQLAAQINPTIKAVLAIAPWLLESTLTTSSLDHKVPVLIISGQLDEVAPTNKHADVHYNYTPTTTSKLLLEIAGGNHATPLNPLTGNEDVGNIAIAWLQLFLKDSTCYCKMLKVQTLIQNSTTSKYITNLHCSPPSKEKLKTRP
jgi:dienelactone hydrolase